MSKKEPEKLADIRRAIKDMIALAKTFDEKRQAIEISMKFEALQHKLKGHEFGKGFDDPGGDDDAF